MAMMTMKSTLDNDKLQIFDIEPEEKDISQLQQIMMDKNIASKIYTLTLDKNKSPICILDEIMIILNKSTVVYSLVAVSGPLHNKLFTMKVKSDDMFAYGYGTSKKVAKTCSANNFLKKIIPYYKTTTSITEKTLSELIQNSCIAEYTENLLNPIGILQELCMSNYWELPKYTTSVKMTDCEQLQFEVTCTHKIFSFKGNGKTKKEAKGHAATLMYRQLKNNFMS